MRYRVFSVNKDAAEALAGGWESAKVAEASGDYSDTGESFYPVVEIMRSCVTDRVGSSNLGIRLDLTHTEVRAVKTSSRKALLARCQLSAGDVIVGDSGRVYMVNAVGRSEGSGSGGAAQTFSMLGSLCAAAAPRK